MGGIPLLAGKALSHRTAYFANYLTIRRGMVLTGNVCLIACIHSFTTLILHFMIGTCSDAATIFGLTTFCSKVISRCLNALSRWDIFTLKQGPSTDFWGISCCGNQIGLGSRICKVSHGYMITQSRKPRNIYVTIWVGSGGWGRGWGGDEEWCMGGLWVSTAFSYFQWLLWVCDDFEQLSGTAYGFFWFLLYVF